jgi:glycosyltransferase involved in cell wall biosynthesis
LSSARRSFGKPSQSSAEILTTARKSAGDACTDDSAELVASYRDPRLHWFNLPTNSGYQSAPHNEGLRRARGRYVAYLNHDDLWLPNHLERLVAALGPTVTARSSDSRSQWRNRQLAWERLAARLDGAARPPRPRHATRPTKSARAERLDGKRRRSTVKQTRRRPSRDDWG